MNNNKTKLEEILANLDKISKQAREGENNPGQDPAQIFKDINHLLGDFDKKLKAWEAKAKEEEAARDKAIEEFRELRKEQEKRKRICSCGGKVFVEFPQINLKIFECISCKKRQYS